MTFFVVCDWYWHCLCLPCCNRVYTVLRGRNNRTVGTGWISN